MKKIFNKPFLISISVFVIGFTAYLLSCAIDSWGMAYYFNPEITQSKTYKPFYRITSQTLYGIEKYSTIADGDSLNILEWQGYFKNKLTYDELAYILYKIRVEDVDAIMHMQNPGTDLKDSLRAVAAALAANKATAGEFLAYLRVAKECEPVAVYGAQYWYDYDDEATKNAKDPRKNEQLTSGLISKVLTALPLAKNTFIRQRYEFQAIRLYYYSRKFQECYNSYRQYAESFPSGITKYRAMSYAAGALVGLKRYAEANYIFSRIYDNCEPMRIGAYYSFHPVEEADWNQCLRLAKSNREKAVLWHLLGIYKDPLRAMQEIYALDTKSDLLDVLVSRYINQLEESLWLGNDQSLRSYQISYIPRSEVIPADAMNFIVSVAKNGNTNKPQLWDLASSYLLTAKGRFDEALAVLAKVQVSGEKDVDICRQVCITRLMCVLNSVSKIDAEVEKKITPDFMYLTLHQPESYYVSDPLNWAKSRLAECYRKQGDVVKGELLDPRGRYFYDKAAQMKKMIAFMDKPEKSEIERYYLLQYPMSRKSLYDYMAVNEFYYGSIEKALALYKEGNNAEKYQVKKAVLDGYYDSLKKVYNGPNIFAETKLLGEPFIIHINDCHDCDHAAEIPVHMTKVEFVNKILLLKNMVDKDPKKHAMQAYELANGFYNATYYGNARVFYVTDVGHNYTSWYDDVDTLKVKPLKELPIYDCSRAAYYYKLAYDNVTNREIKAECAFMLAKCEQNAFFYSKPADYPGDFKAGKYFRLLKKEYSQTNYYKEIIQECGYFRTFLSSK